MIPFLKKNKDGKKPPKPTVPRTAQESIPFQRMFEDGTCRVRPGYYTRTIQYQDINYQLAQQEDKTAIFEEWCSFLNFFDSSIHFELSFVNTATDSADFEKSIRIPYQQDGFDDVRAEYSQMLRQQLSKGNNGLTKTKFLTYGIEGVHYEKTSDTSIKLLDASSKYTTDYYTLGNELIMYTVDPQARDLWDQYRAFNDASKPSVLVGFSFNNENVKTEYASVMNITAQYLPQLFTGSAADVDQTVAEMNQKLYDAGLQKIIEDMQKQIDEWAAKQK